MTEEFDNSLDPILNLTYSVVDDQYVYELSVQVPDFLLDPTPVEEITDQQEVGLIATTSGFTVMSEEVNDVYLLESTDSEKKGVKTVRIPIKNNPKGENGAIIVLITPIKTLLESPRADGKAIIRFEKARLH